jgi:hypothetical protein
MTGMGFAESELWHGLCIMERLFMSGKLCRGSYVSNKHVRSVGVHGPEVGGTDLADVCGFGAFKKKIFQKKKNSWQKLCQGSAQIVRHAGVFVGHELACMVTAHMYDMGSKIMQFSCQGVGSALDRKSCPGRG